MDTTKIDMNAPAFGAGSQSLQDLMDTRTPETSVEEQEAPITTEEVAEVESVEETKVPYSRFKKYHDSAKQAQQEAEYWRAKAEELEQTRSYETKSQSNSIPDYWIELYGDSEASQRAWEVQSRANAELRDQLMNEARESARNERYEEQQRIEINLSTIDENFEELSDVLGRQVTEKEQSAVLDIVDEYTPKDSDGNYLGVTLPFHKAWEIYELKKGSANAPQRKERDSVAALSSTNTQGETNFTEKDKNFNPLDWHAWKKRL